MKTQKIKNTEDIKLLIMQEKDIAEVLKIQSETGLSVWTKRDYQIEIESLDSICMVAKTDKREIIGFAVVKLLTGEDESDTSDIRSESSFDSSEIYNIAVRNEFQSRGIGQVILEQIIRHLQALSVLDIWLEVRESNTKARSFYEKNGFLQEFVRKSYYQNPVEDAHILKLKINYENKT
jgi:ribosomal-protein-alanine N-acetyltransferase